MLYPHQREGVEWLARTRRGLLADDQGLGKTIQVIVAARQLGLARVLVVAPSAVACNWRAEFRKWWPGVTVRVLASSADTVDDAQGVVVVTHGRLFREPLLSAIRRERFDLVVVDEAHHFRTPDAKRTLALYSGREAVARLAPRCWILTGTPLPNGDPAETWPMLAGIAPERIRDENGKLLTATAWRDRFGVLTPGAYGAKVTALKNLPELNRRLAGFMLRRLKSKVLTLPPIRWATVALDADVDLPERGDAVELADIVEREDGEPFALWRHRCGLAKVPGAVELIANDLDGGMECVVVFAHHRDVIAGLARGLEGFAPATLTGDDNAERKGAIVAEFQAGKRRVLIVQLGAGGVGITLTRASDVVFVESSPVPGDMAQCADRLHRIGQKSSVLARILAVAGSVDEVFAEILERKAAMVSDVLRPHTR